MFWFNFWTDQSTLRDKEGIRFCRGIESSQAWKYFVCRLNTSIIDVVFLSPVDVSNIFFGIYRLSLGWSFNYQHISSKDSNTELLEVEAKSSSEPRWCSSRLLWLLELLSGSLSTACASDRLCFIRLIRWWFLNWCPGKSEKGRMWWRGGHPCSFYLLSSEQLDWWPVVRIWTCVL